MLETHTHTQTERERERNWLYKGCCLVAQAAELTHDHSQINSGSCLCGSVM